MCLSNAITSDPNQELLYYGKRHKVELRDELNVFLAVLFLGLGELVGLVVREGSG